MEPKRTTVKDVARAAGVSLMTVSRAINGQSGISEETRARILSLAQEMSYRPSQIARSLATRKTNTLGLVVPDVSNPFFASIARGAEDAAYEHGFNIFLVNSTEMAERELAGLESLWQKEVTGVILCSSRLDQTKLQDYYERFSRMVQVNRSLDNLPANVSSISVKDEAGTEIAVRRFLDKGKKHLALIAGPLLSQSGQKRKTSFIKSLIQAKLPVDDSFILHCPPTLQGGVDSTKKLLERHPEIDAISAYNDLVAAGALQALKSMGKHIPQDVAVIGVDDIPLASLVQPSLTTLKVDLYTIGRMTVNYFLDATNKESDCPQKCVVQPVLVIRESG